MSLYVVALLLVLSGALTATQTLCVLLVKAIDYQGWAMEDAVVDASAQAGFQGIGYPNVLVANNIDVANMKKSLSGKIHYEKPGAKEAALQLLWCHH
jgi:hypothetical protein